MEHRKRLLEEKVTVYADIDEELLFMYDSPCAFFMEDYIECERSALQKRERGLEEEEEIVVKP